MKLNALLIIICMLYQVKIYSAQTFITDPVKATSKDQKNAARKIKKFLRETAQSNKGIGGSKISMRDISGELELDLDENPTEESLKNFLLKEFIAETPKSKLIVKRTTGGFANDGVYKAYLSDNPTKNIFFLKITSNQDPQPLIKMQEGPIGRIGTKVKDTHTKQIIPKQNLPAIAWAEQFFTYRKPHRGQAMLSILHSAQGQSIKDIINDGDDGLKLESALALGRSLGSFQQAFMIYHDPTNPKTWRTAEHGDLNYTNILFDPQSKRTYFIDNISMSLPEPENEDDIEIRFDITKDMEKLFSSILEWQTPSDPIELIKTFLFPFLKAYIESFPVNKRKILTEYLQNNSIMLYDRTTGTLKNLLKEYEKTL